MGRASGWGAAARVVLAVAPWIAPASVHARPVPVQAEEVAPERQAELPIVQAITVEGAQRYRPEELADALGQEVGQPLDPRAVNDGLRKLWESLKVRGSVFERLVPGGIELQLLVEEMSVDLEPVFVGNDDIDEDELLEWAGLEGRDELFLFQSARVRSRLLANYRKEGYYWAEVEVVGDREDEVAPDVTFRIREGPKVRVRDVIVNGNDSLPDQGFWWWAEGLSSEANPKLKGARWWSLRFLGTPFDVEELEADLVALRQVYRDHGFLDAIVEVETLEFNDDRDRVTIHITVDEGEPYVVASVDVQAFEEVERDNRYSVEPSELLFPHAELMGLLELEAGSRYEQRTVDRDRASLRDHYGERGHVDHVSLPPSKRWRFLDPELTFDVEARRVHVVYRVVQGRPLTLREIRIAGTHHTRDEVVRSRITVFPGQLANLPEIDRSLRRILGTTYFSDSANPQSHPEPTYRFREVEGEPNQVDLEFVVLEGRVVQTALSGAIDTNNGLTGELSLQFRNFDIADLPSSFWSMFGEVYDKKAFHGAGQTLDLRFRPGTRRTTLQASYVYPDVFDTDLRPIDLGLEFQRYEFRRRRFDEDRFLTRVNLSRLFENDVRLSAGFTWGWIEANDVSLGSPPLLVQQDQEGRQGLVGPTLRVSGQDTDHPFLPHEGWRASLSTTAFVDGLGGDYSYVDTVAGADLYLPTYTKDDGTQHVLHAVLDAKVAVPYGATDDVPYSQRYQLGGRSTLRGFAFQGVGPVDRQLSFGNGSDTALGDPLGGETSLSGTIEYLVPLNSVPSPLGGRIESVRGGVFFDWGVLDPDAFQLDLDEIRASVGFSIGLVHPIPIQLNFGFPVIDKDGDDKQLVSFSFAF